MMKLILILLVSILARALSPEDAKAIQDYSAGVVFLNNVGLQGQAPTNPPRFLSATVKAAAEQCFPNNSQAQDWIYQMLAKGHPSVWNVFFIQSFRNSELAKRLRDEYKAADHNRRQKLAQQMRSSVGNDMAYQLLFESSFRPLLYTTDPSPPEDLKKCASSPTSQSCWDDHIIDSKTKQERIYVCHWLCDQPQIYYYRHHPKADGGTYRTQNGSFAFYLGNKGNWSLTSYGNSLNIQETPPEGIAGLLSPSGKAYREAVEAYKRANYCEDQESCPKGKIPKQMDISEQDGRECLARFFTGSQEAIKRQVSPPSPPSRKAVR